MSSAVVKSVQYTIKYQFTVAVVVVSCSSSSSLECEWVYRNIFRHSCRCYVSLNGNNTCCFPVCQWYSGETRELASSFCTVRGDNVNMTAPPSVSRATDAHYICTSSGDPLARCIALGRLGSQVYNLLLSLASLYRIICNFRNHRSTSHIYLQIKPYRTVIVNLQYYSFIYRITMHIGSGFEPSID